MQGYFLHELSLSTMEGKMTKGCLTNVGRNLYKRKLNLSRPWQVSDLELLLTSDIFLMKLPFHGGWHLE